MDISVLNFFCLLFYWKVMRKDIFEEKHVIISVNIIIFIISSAEIVGSFK